MAAGAAGYVLLVSDSRRQVLVDAMPDFEYRGIPLSEPVPLFDHSRRSPLVVFASFEDGFITHIADGSKGNYAGTGLSRLNFTKWLKLSKPIAFGRLVESVPKRLQAHLRRNLKAGGLLPPKTVVGVVTAMINLAPETSDRLARFSASRIRRIARIGERSRTNLAFQKEMLSASLAIARIDRDEGLNWVPPDGEMNSFLDGLPGADVREDTMLIVDHGVVPGFDLGGQTHVASKVFHRRGDSTRLTVVMANRTTLEEQTGADLIYFNERYKAFVFVQYKAMRQESVGHVFRWKDDASDDLVKEIARMDGLLTHLAALGDDGTKEGFRLHENPFFLKLCPKVVLDPDDKGLFSGMYIPLAYWKRFEKDASSKGPKGGQFASFDNIGRKLTNSEFIPLVAGAWVGTTIPQSAVLQTLIRDVLSRGRTVTLAIESPGTHPEPDGSAGRYFDGNPLDLFGTDDEESELEPPLQN